MNTWKNLGYLGLVPFLLGILALVQPKAISNINPDIVFIGYSAIILSFIGGTFWQANASVQQTPRIISNLISLVAFVCLLIDQHIAIIVLGVSFVAAYVYERYFLSLVIEVNQDDDTRLSNQAYLTMRKNLTAIVFALHIIAFSLI